MSGTKASKMESLLKFTCFKQDYYYYYYLQVLIVTTSLLILKSIGEDGKKTFEYCNATSQDLTEEEKQRQMSNWHDYGQEWISNMYLFPSLSKHLLGDNETAPELLKHYSPLRQSLTKTKCKLNYKSREIMDRATCPWYLEFSFDPWRYPTILVSANCSCRKCKHTYRHKEDKETECVPLTVRVKILRRRLSKEGNLLCLEGKALYENTWERINTACTCVVRRTSLQHRTYMYP